MSKRGFTLVEMTVVLAVIAILAAILVPTIAKNIKDAKITRAINEEQVIVASVMSFYKDVGKWPFATAGTARLLSGEATDAAPTAAAAGAQSGAANWGSLTPAMQLYSFLYYNDPNGNSTYNEAGVDYPIQGEYCWRGPYIDRRSYLDPWGNPYVISAHYFPGNLSVAETVKAGHQVLVLSAGPDVLWSTAFANAVTRLSPLPGDSPAGDDIGQVVMTNN